MVDVLLVNSSSLNLSCVGSFEDCNGGMLIVAFSEKADLVDLADFEAIVGDDIDDCEIINQPTLRL